MTLWYDDREPAKLINQLVQQVPDAQSRRMDAGDYVFDEFGGERKTPTDLLGSIFDGRYWKQLANLKNTYLHPFVIIEGSWIIGQRKRSGVDWSSSDVKLINGVINSTLLKWSVPIVYTSDYVDTAKKLSEFYDMSEKKTTPPRSVVVKEDTPDKVRFAMLQTIRGLGPMGATRILNKYGFRELVEIGEAETLMKNVVGLNRRVAERVVKVFHDA